MQARREALDAARVIDPGDRHLLRELALHGAPRRDAAGVRLRMARRGEQGVEQRRMEAGIVERAAGLSRLKHGAEEREPYVAGNAGDENVESFGRRAPR